MPNRILIVTGMSGAGKSSVLNTLEDLGYEVVDNLPLSLMEAFLKQTPSQTGLVAVGIDSRTRDFDADVLLKTLKPYKGKILFLDCSDDELQNRFSATRRRHPLAKDEQAIEGIRAEREMLVGLKEHADYVIETTQFDSVDLRNSLLADFDPDITKRTVYTVMSFSFAKGVPPQADFVFDVRFLKNPFYDEDLKEKDGRDKAVQAYIQKDPDFEKFFTQVTEMVDPLLPRFKQEGKNYVTFAFGCTGGQHRSVFLAESFHQWLNKVKPNAKLLHRDVK